MGTKSKIYKGCVLIVLITNIYNIFIIYTTLRTPLHPFEIKTRLRQLRQSVLISKNKITK